MNSTTPLLVLIDGMALAYRSYFAFIARPLMNIRGENTSAVYGFTVALLQFLEQHKPTHAAVCFDTYAPTFRHDMFKEYKANRESTPDDLLTQLHTIKEIIRGYHIPLLEIDGYEADDIIGTLAHQANARNLETIIITPDKDFCQLVTENIKLLRPARGEVSMEMLDTQAVTEKYGLRPEQFIDYLALIGDKVDNIPGVRGVGEKTATPLLAEHGSLAGIYANLDKITKKGLHDKLVSERENAFLSQELAKIMLDVPVNITIDDLTYKFDPDFRKLEAIFKEMNVKTLLAKLKAEEKATGVFIPEDAPVITEEEPQVATSAEYVAPAQATNIHSTPHEYRTLYELKDVKAFATELAKQKEFCFDLETTSNKPMAADIVGMSFSYQASQATYIPICLPQMIESTTLFDMAKAADSTKNACNTGHSLEAILPLFKKIFEDENIAKIGQNIKYDTTVLMRQGIRVHPVGFDTMVAASLLRNEGALGMDDLAEKYLNYTPISLTSVAGKLKLKRETSDEIMASINTDTLAEYGAEDADVAYRLKLAMEEGIRNDGLTHVTSEVEFPLIEVLTKVEFDGVKIDTEMLARVSKEMEEEARAIRDRIYTYSGYEFNIDSTKQLAEVLFKKLMLQPIKKTKTGYSTDAYVLEQLKAQHPVAEELLNYRQYQKLRSTYVDALPLLVDKKTGRIHTNYNQAVAATGRLSSQDPNLQNIPIRTEMGRGLRKAFVSRFPSGSILSADYSQIELRIMAHVTKDAGLLAAFESKEDIHTSTSAAVFGVPKEEVTRDMRRKAKEINYGIMYGIGAFGLASRLGIPQKEGADIIKRYFMAFPSIKEFIDSTIVSARKKGYVTTLLGRRRYFTNINASNSVIRAADERAAINAPIQGSAAELIKVAMIRIQRDLWKRDLKSLMIMQVHDELVFDIHPGEEEVMMPLVRDHMENAIPMDVAIEVDAGIGKTWFDAH